MILLVAALPFEAKPFRTADWPEHHPIAIGVTGAGPEAGYKRALMLIERYRPDIVIGVGVCGGLDKSSKTGDVVFPAEFRSDQGEKCLSVTGMAGVTPAGRMVSVGKVANTPQGKDHLGAVYKAKWVDQESYGWCLAAQSQGVPVVIARVVLDSVEDYLPSWRHPASWQSLPSLPFRALAARKNLFATGRRLVCGLS